MPELTQAEKDLHSLWGQAFEIAVKAGVIAGLAEAGLLGEGAHPSAVAAAEEWRQAPAGEVTRAFLAEVRSTGIDDPDVLGNVRTGLNHVRLMGAGIGQTVIREIVRRRGAGPDRMVLRTLWSPLSLPKVGGESWEGRAGSREDFGRSWAHLCGGGTDGFEDLFSKGRAGNADLCLLFEPLDPKGAPLLLVVEMSMNVPPEVMDHGFAEAHLREVATFAARSNARSVFSQVKAEVAGGEGFDLSSEMPDLLPAFAGRDKPIYKLCQACSYLDGFATLATAHAGTRHVDGLALSLTHMGVESISARFGTDDPRIGLVRDMGLAYQRAKSSSDDPEGTLGFVRDALGILVRRLPRPLSQPFTDALKEERLGGDFSVEAVESMVACDVEAGGGFHNPCHVFTAEEAEALAGADADVAKFLGESPAAVARGAAKDGKVSLRGLHGAMVAKAIRAVEPGTVAVLGLEGNPGIGKTTATGMAIKEQADDGLGTMLVYVSPRLVINEDVTGSFSRDPRNRTLCLTTNSRLISGAPIWHAEQVKAGKREKRAVDSAVCWSGLPELNEPAGACLFLTPEEKDEAETGNTGPGFRKTSETERRDRVSDERRPGVLGTLATAARKALQENRDVRGLVLTAAMQGLRTASGLAGFDKLFDTKPTAGGAALTERLKFAERFPRIVFMVDEIAGDGAGAPFVVQAKRFLESQFIKPFRDAGQESPFACALVAADASLSNEEVIARYLGNDKGSPDKVLVSPSRGGTPFSLAYRPLKLGPGPQVPALHVMTNSFPANRLTLRYLVRFTHLRPQERAPGQPMTERELVREQQRDNILTRIHREVERALVGEARQVVVFLQDKALLRDLRRTLVSGSDDLLLPGLLARAEVTLIDNNVETRERTRIVSAEFRDTYRVILMTSSGARGISFPSADRIIAVMPRFNPESALMEVAQVVYRGRGGDGDRHDREITLMVDDYVVREEEPDIRNWFRRVSDLVTLACLARATLLTRITGDAGFPGRSLAVVPVGAVGTEGTVSTMSQAVRDIRVELDSAKRDDDYDDRRRGLFAQTERLVVQTFASLHLRSERAGGSPASLTRDDFVGRYRDAWTSEIGPLVPNAPLPETAMVGGPFAVERLADFDEEFVFEGWERARQAVYGSLMGCLRLILDDRDVPNRLRKCAKSLLDILDRSTDRQRNEFSTIKSVKAEATWLVTPVDRGAFSLPDEAGRRKGLGGKDEDWLVALGACVGTDKGMPVIPSFEEFPFFVKLGGEDPLGFEAVFDGRYLSATREFNLLNVLMLAKKPG